MYKYWDFKRKGFHRSHHISFKTDIFPTLSNFDEPPAGPPIVPNQFVLSNIPSSDKPQPIYDSIRVFPPPDVQVYTTVINLPTELISYKDATSLSHPD